MPKRLLFSGNWCRVIKADSAYLVETQDGLDGLGQPRWVGNVSRNMTESFAELGKEIDRLQVENDNLRQHIATLQAALDADKAKVVMNKRK